ncbi:DUF6270 domain-containing protein [Paenilisteria rocourtiae]|uniref:Uncharacterized protein n=1 Tax=Listeria rocourtiae TaxID=647910 RepID=A0A4R6ZRE6_9LIST|nr:DUF6270 domain-containing protein [Listeria rocourtiae]EUJ48425.1 hypothetical protein PROCOU_05743 [Listeria rocourtiae FSL F6-920]MBC1605805.1 hypothetical protein [Listeria rocourtiae]TDR54794.1 hypothetical protein DFP96_102389 [Listeria rocourtiae]
MKKIAVLGSCATRDNFNSIFNADYKKKFECVLMQNQSSIISMASNKRANPVVATDEFSEYDEWCVRSDFTKEFFDHLERLQPDTIIVDLFGDAHFGVLEIEPGQYVSNNRWKLWRTAYYKDMLKGKVDELSIDKNREAYMEVWKKSWDIVLGKLKKASPKSKIILHKIQNVKEYYNFDDNRFDIASSGKVKNIDVDYYNEILNEMYAYIKKSDKSIKTIDVFTSKKEFLSFDEHPWGLFYVHYTMDYYPLFMNQLIAIEKENSWFSIFRKKRVAE